MQELYVPAHIGLKIQQFLELLMEELVDVFEIEVEVVTLVEIEAEVYIVVLCLA